LKAVQLIVQQHVRFISCGALQKRTTRFEELSAQVKGEKVYTAFLFPQAIFRLPYLKLILVFTRVRLESGFFIETTKTAELAKAGGRL
jgi:hypothetical protein